MDEPGTFQKIYRVVRWIILAGLVLVLFLLLKNAPPPEVQQDPEAGARVEQKMIELQQAVDAGQPHTLTLEEAELNSFLQSNLALQADTGSGATYASPRDPTLEEVQSTVRDVRVNLVDDRVRAYVVFDLHGKDLTLTLEGRLRAVNGYLRLEPTGGMLGSLPLLQTTLDSAVERLFESPENKEKFRLPPEIRDIRIVNGQLEVQYY
jgi:hypothetical protein